MSPRFLALTLFLWTVPAFADLYRWVDPETGSVKYSSYPPPWYGDEEREKRAPKVEHIPERKPAPGTPVDVPGPTGLPGAATAPGAQRASLESLDLQRKRLMLELGSPSAPRDLQGGGAVLKKQIESFAAVNTEMDRLDPAGADKRRAEAQPVLERLVEGLRPQPKPAPGSR
jgi:hypothetical protein